MDKKLPMEFNPGLKKYEPKLPLRKTGKKVKLKVDWKLIIFLCLVILIFIGGLYWILY